MPTRELLWLAAILLVFIGVAHSYLGERFILNRLLALSNLPLLRRDRGYTERMFRYAWHITSVYFWGCAAILAVLAFQGTVDVRTLGMVLAAIFLVSAAITFAIGPRHPAWPLFLLAAAATWLATSHQ